MIRRVTLAVALFILCLFAAPPTASGFDPFPVCNGGGGGSAVCKDSGSSGSKDPIVTTMQDITNIVAFIAGAAAIIIIIISAIKFITSGSDVSTGSRTDTDVEDARRSIANALIGLVVIVLARTLIIFILNKL